MSLYQWLFLVGIIASSIIVHASPYKGCRIASTALNDTNMVRFDLKDFVNNFAQSGELLRTKAYFMHEQPAFGICQSKKSVYFGTYKHTTTYGIYRTHNRYLQQCQPCDSETNVLAFSKGGYVEVDFVLEKTGRFSVVVSGDDRFGLSCETGHIFDDYSDTEIEISYNGNEAQQFMYDCPNQSNGQPSRSEERWSSLEVDAKAFLIKVNEKLKTITNVGQNAAYNYNTNVNKENQVKMIEVETENSKYAKEVAEEIKKRGFHEIQDYDEIKRQIKMLSKLSLAALSTEDYNTLMNAISNMQSNYATVKVCSYENRTRCDFALDPHIQERVEKSRDADELAYYWKEWYDNAGLPAKDNFKTYIDLTRKSAKINGLKSYADDWVDEYDDKDFEANVDKIYNEILPFYKELHAYVRHRLRENYGAERFPRNGNIPMHLLGNLWAQDWNEVIDLINPYPDTSVIDITDEMVKQGYTPEKIFRMGDDFFQSLNMPKLPELFWTKSVLKKPEDPNRRIVCHASSWNFFKKDDVRIKQCTEITQAHFYTAHHELGHIQYYLQYQDQPMVFRSAPNPGFHEAVGDTIALSVSSPKHLKKIGLIKNGDLDEKRRINALFKQALHKIIFLPFAYTMDKYRYGVFRDEIKESNWNCAWWKMRSAYGGVEPAIERSQKDFDPAAKFHTVANVEYLRYFASYVFQFQFHKALCIKAGQFDESDPQSFLDNCDIYGSHEAGDAFKEFLSVGSSKNWREVLEKFTGDKEMSSKAILNYFEPLRKWLKEEIKRLNLSTGWIVTDKCK